MSRQVFIIWQQPLFRETVRLLLEQPTIEIVGLSSEDMTTWDDIKRLQPDTIVIEEAEESGEISSRILQILETCSWEPRVIRLSLQDNELRVYRRERWTIDSTEELLRLIRDE